MARWDDEGLEQRFDRWVETGRQLVDGVAGARPGSRGAGRGQAQGQGRRLASRLNPGELGRWVEGKLDWLLDEEGDDDWREPWQSQPLTSRQPDGRQPSARRRPLEAISRRVRDVVRPVEPPPPAGPPSSEPQLTGEWPDDEAFSVSRWQRQPGPAAAERGRQVAERQSEPPNREPSNLEPPTGGRPLPRSSRSRFRR
ncbi:MAG: hypothetical protein RLZZ336_2093 [Cyanobacteriota bacterium]